MATVVGLGVVGFTGWMLYKYFNSRGRRNNNAESEHEDNAANPDLQENRRQDANLNEQHEVEEKVGQATEDLERKVADDTKEVKNQDVIIEREQDYNDQRQEMEFETNPTFVKTMRTKAAKKDSKAIFGLTVLKQELFIISQHSPEVEVYDSQSLAFKHQFQLEDLYDPIDIKSCSKSNCFYIFDWGESSSKILRFGPDGKLITRWKTKKDGGFISVTQEASVILSVWNKNLLNEFTADGRLIREIQLPASISELRLAIKLSSGHFVVSHGEGEESEHRICLVDEEGLLIKSIGGKQGSSEGEFNNPNYMVATGTGFILVADQNNKRVVLLSPGLEFKQELIQERDGLRYPVRMEMDQTSGRLFVADNDYQEQQTGWRDGKVMAFDFQIYRTS